jgi:serine phosphatase RsbU (regulator of sigma subunit)
VITDGVSEAQDPAGALFGGARVEAMLARMGRGGATAQSVVEALQADVGVFVAGAEPADDITILALRWQGPVSAG